MTEAKVRGILALEIAKAGTALAFANKHGIAPSYVSETLRGRKEPAKKVLDALGLERVVSYRRKADV